MTMTREIETLLERQKRLEKRRKPPVPKPVVPEPVEELPPEPVVEPVLKPPVEEVKPFVPPVEPPPIEPFERKKGEYLSQVEAEARGWEFTEPIPSGWQVRVWGDGEYAYLVSPEGWEYTGRSVIDPTGKAYTIEDYEKLLAEQGRLGAEQAERVEAFEAVFPEEDIESMLRGMSVTPDMTPVQQHTALEAQDEFIDRIQAEGRTPDTEALLRQLGVTEDDIALFFPEEVYPGVPFPLPEGREPIVVEIAGQPQTFSVDKDNIVYGETDIPVAQLDPETGELTVLEADLSQKLEAQKLSPEEARTKYDANLLDIAKKYPSPPYTRDQMKSDWYKAMMDEKTLAFNEWKYGLVGGEPLDPWISLEIFGRGLTRVPRLTAASILQAFQGQGGASVTDKDWADRFIGDAGTDLNKFVEEVNEKYGDRITAELAQFPQNFAFSITSMGTGLAVGVPTALAPVPGSRVAAFALGTAVSGLVAYQMTTYQIMQQYLELKDAEKRAETGRGLTLEEENRLKDEFYSLAMQYGLWEAVPEALSNLAFVSILTAPLTSMIGKSLATQILSKIVGMYGQEFLTETITQKGQSAIEVQAGLREGDIGWLEAFKEIAPQTFLLTTLMGGAGQTIISTTKAIKKVRASLKNEIGESHPLYKEFLDKAIDRVKEIHEEQRGAIGIPEEVPATLPLDEISKYETRIPLDLIRKDEAEYLERLTREIEKEGITEPVTIRIREDGSRIVWDGIHRLIVAQNLGIKNVPVKFIGEEGKPVAKIEPEPVPEVPIAEPGMPEAGLQPSMIEEVPFKEVRPVGKGEVVQISMEEQLKLAEARRVAEREEAFRRVGEAEAEVAGLKEILATDPVATAKFTIAGKKVDLTHFISIKEQTFPEYFTIKQAQALYPEHDFSKYTQKGLPTYNRVPKDEALDDLTKKFGMSPDEIANRVMAIRAERARIKELEAEIAVTAKPLPPAPDITSKEVATNLATPGTPTLTPAQATRTLDLFGKYIADPGAENAWELTRELRRETRAVRAENLKARSQQLIIEEGVSPEEAIKQAIKETMSGELPTARTDYLDDLTQEMRASLFSKLYHTLKDEPFEMASTTDALTNALLGKPIPREPGIRGGSAYTRLQRVFGDQPQVMKALDTVSKEGKSLKNVVEGLYHEIGRIPIPVDEKMAEYLRNLPELAFAETMLPSTARGILRFEPTGKLGLELTAEQMALVQAKMEALKVSDLRTPAELEYALRKLNLSIQLSKGEITKDAYDIEVSLAYDKAYPTPPVTKFEAPIEKAFEQYPMFTFMEKKTIVKVLKQLAYSPLDIGNFMRAMKASFDQSFPRQARLIASGHPMMMYRAYIAAWQATFSQPSTEAAWERITRDPDYQIYEEIREATGHDPLRVPAFAQAKGIAQYRTAEEFGFPTQERWIPALTGKIPTIKLSERGFVTGLNDLIWANWKAELKFDRKYSERVASGQITLKEGESYSIIQEMSAFQAFLADAIQRGTLPERARGLAPAFNAFFFALRSKLGRFFVPRHLISSNARVRKEAWKDFILMHSIVGGIMLLGDWLDLWDTEKDHRNAEFMSARIGNVRIDPWAGYRQFVVLYARLATGTGISSVTGAEYEADPLRALWTFTRNSFSPLLSTLVDFWTGRNFLGQVVEITNARQWLDRVLPFAIQDVWEAYEEDALMGALMVLPAIHGEGIQTYTGDWVENFTKLGLPKYLENTAYGITEPAYDVKDFWSDTSSQFAGVDPATLTEEKGFPGYIRGIAEARIVNEHLKTLPNEKLYTINADPAEGKTFADLRNLWLERQKLVVAGDDAEYTISELQPDKTYKDVVYKGEDAVIAFDAKEITGVPDITKQGTAAALGNFTQAQFSLLMQYHAITDVEDQKEFLEKQKTEIGINSRVDWLTSHSKENALLAVWGQAKVFTQEAYDETQRLIKEFDIPGIAIDEYLPPEDVAKTHFSYLETGDEFGWNSWETQLVLAKDLDYCEWAKLDKPDSPIPALELKVKNRELSDTYDGYSDKDSPLYIEDKEDREEARDTLKTDNPGWVDDLRRIEAIEHGTTEIPTLDRLVDGWVDRGKVVDEFTAGSSEAKVWLLDTRNPDSPFYGTFDWALGKGLLEEDGIDWNEPVLRVNVKWKEEDDRYDAWGDVNSPSFIEDDTDRRTTRAEFLDNNEPYRMDRYRRDAYGLGFSEENIESYVAYYELPVAGYRQERMLVEDRKFAQEMKALKDIHIPGRVPSEQYDILLEKEDRTPEDERRMAAYKIYFPEDLIDTYVDWYITKRTGYLDDWFLMDNRDFYEAMVVRGVLTRRDFSKVPSKDLAMKLAIYKGLDYYGRLNFRARDPELEQWKVEVEGLEPIRDRGDPLADISRQEELAREIAEGLARVQGLGE